MINARSPVKFELKILKTGLFYGFCDIAKIKCRRPNHNVGTIGFDPGASHIFT